MKKLYEAPTVEKIKFNYRDQVVAASGENDPENISGGSGGCGSTAQGLGDAIGYLLSSSAFCQWADSWG